MTARTATVALGVAGFAVTTVVLIIAIVRTAIFGIWAGAQGAYVTAEPPANIYVLWSSVATLVWTLLVLPLLFAGLIQMVRYRPSGRYLVAFASAFGLACGLYTVIRWDLGFGWAALLAIPLLTTILAVSPATRGAED